MIPLQGLIAQVLGVVALVVIWERPIPVLWWCILGLLIAGWYFKALTKASFQTNGPKNPITVTLGIVLTVIQLVVIGLSIYSFIRQPDSDTSPPELSEHFEGREAKYVGAFHDNHVYIPANEEGTFEAGALADDHFVTPVMVAREEFAVLLYNQQDQTFGIFEAANPPDDLHSVEFVRSDAAEKLSAAWSLARNKSSSNQVRSGREGREWIYVDVLFADSNETEHFYVSPEVREDSVYLYTTLLIVNEQQNLFFFDPDSKRFAPVRTDPLWTPLEDIEYRPMEANGVGAAVWKVVKPVGEP